MAAAQPHQTPKPKCQHGPHRPPTYRGVHSVGLGRHDLRAAAVLLAHELAEDLDARPLLLRRVDLVVDADLEVVGLRRVVEDRAQRLRAPSQRAAQHNTHQSVGSPGPAAGRGLAMATSPSRGSWPPR
ncbi:hypothetical protein ON010_g12220 [Phytophthora cinnamomi]|nr:hypothetical protein ON010_g12220 [Phytophthora cinnamomi]